MRLLEIGPDFKVLLNKDWLLLIPQFKRLIHRDKGSQGDNDGRKKYKAIKEFTYIYHISDPRSPLENFDAVEREEKALEYAELGEREIDKDVLDALSEYEVLLDHATPSLSLLRAAKRSQEQVVNHFNTIDFSERDKQGKAVHSVTNHVKSVKELKQMHDSIRQFEDIVFDELKEAKSTRGKTELGDREEGTTTKRKWKESGPKEDDEDTKKIFADGPSANTPSFMNITSFSGKLDEE